ncbi:putative PAP-specific phosphatase [Hibiscus syriacus]|uniref:PAP-specific phosphatase n=1 Tax=Hibiscus syriacus TaxID=106335 RepID=A0A6A3CGV6_HIBSY|nr:putative PAP-specific phosphatase [Hibiscus syriacus]
MDLHLLRSSPAVRFFPRRPSPPPLRRRFFAVSEKAKYRKEIEAAVEVVERACSLCIDVQRSLFSDKGGILEKNDQTPVTVADFGVQALVSLELGRLFPSIPLVAEEDSGYIRSKNLVDPIRGKECLWNKTRHLLGNALAIYISLSILDPIDGTRGFVKGSKALYVVGLSLVVEGKILLGVMGFPNWVVDTSYRSTNNVQGYPNSSGLGIIMGIIMAAHVGCGTWTKRLRCMLDSSKISSDWTRCFVDGCGLVQKAHFCTPESQPWESLPLSVFYKATIDNDDDIGDKGICLIPRCCGSLCKYLMVASGWTSVFILRYETVAKAWDHASGMICVHEAGGKTMSFICPSLPYSWLNLVFVQFPIGKEVNLILQPIEINGESYTLQVPVKTELVRRGVILNSDNSCRFCLLVPETDPLVVLTSWHTSWDGSSRFGI